MKEQPLVSIIIVNFNGQKLLEKCLDSLLKTRYTNYEIIIVDNHSTDGSVDFVKKQYPKVIIIELEKNFGFVYPNNLATKMAKGDYLFFLNNDTEVTPSFLENIVKVMDADDKIGICQSLLLKPDGTVDSSGDFIDSIGVPFSSKEIVKTNRNILSAKAAAMMVRKSVFEKLGGFDENFVISFEDVDLGWRSWIYGYKVILIPNSIVYHYGGKTIPKTDIDIDLHGTKNHLVMKITNFEGKSIIRKLIHFSLLYGPQIFHVWLDYKIKGKTNIMATKYERKISKKPNWISIFKGVLWIIKNYSYLKQRSNFINENRIYSTHQLEQLNLIQKK